MRKRRDIKLVTTEAKRNYLVSESNYHTTKFFPETLLVIEIKKTQTFMNKLVYLSLSLSINWSMYKFWDNYFKRKYVEKAKLCYINKGSLIVYIKTEDISSGITKDVETTFDTSNYELDRPLPKGKNKKVIGLVKDELGEG